MNRSRISETLSVVLLTALSLAPLLAAAKTIHAERSLYRNIVVREYDDRRCLIFTVVRGDKNQSCIELDHPDWLVFSYTRMVFAGLLVEPSPMRILIAGLGGGSIPTTLHALLPDAAIDVVEIDEAVARVAKQFFGFKEDDRLHVAIRDARVFVKRAAAAGRTYDLVILDAFTGEYIPEHLMTVEFLEEVKSILTPDGVLVANTFSNSDLYHHESVTYQKVWGPFFNFKLPESGNRVIVASRKPLPDPATLRERAAAMAKSVKPFGIEIERYAGELSLKVDWDETRRPLTDQYSPANLLRKRNDGQNEETMP